MLVDGITPRHRRDRMARMDMMDRMTNDSMPIELEKQPRRKITKEENRDPGY